MRTMRKTKKIFGSLIFLVLVTPVSAQEFTDPLARKLTDFLPTYTPFTPPEPPDRYFPDEVGKKVADAITDAYLQNPEGVAQQAYALAQHDAALVAQGEHATGVTRHVQALVNESPEKDKRE